MLTRIEMEARRHRAAAMLAAGKSQAAVANELGVSRMTTSRWAKEIAAGSDLKRRKAPGRPRKLTAEQEAAVAKVYALDKPTVGAMARYIAGRFNVQYDETTVARLLERLGVRTQRKNRVWPAGFDEAQEAIG